MDFGLLCLGAGAAFIWFMNPFAVAFLFVVVYLLHSVLRVPSLERTAYPRPQDRFVQRRILEQPAEEELSARTRPSRSPALRGNGDFDILREINNTFGHMAGDAVDQESGTNPASAGPRHRHRGPRFGGEGLPVLMPDTTKGEAVIQAEAMRKAIEAAEFTVAHDTMPIKVTMSFGIAECEGPNQSVEGLLHSADLAMYEAAGTGRNQCCVL